VRLLLADWQGFLEDVSLWAQLSIPSRKAFLDGIRPGLGIETTADDPAMSELREAGLLSDYGSTGYLSVDPDFSRLHRLLKILERIAVFESPGFDILREYFSEHFTRAERTQLHESLAFHPDDFGRISGLVASTDWLESFLSRAPSLERGTGKPGAAALHDARDILRFFMNQRDHVPLRDMEEYFPKLGTSLAAALKLGVQSAVFFLSLRRSDLEPMIGIWPSVARRLKRAEIALVPEPVVAEATFCHPFLLEDMATVLLAANVEPIPMRRSDEKPFSRFEEEISASLLSLPAWLEEFTGATPRIRVGSALAALHSAGLIRAGRDGEALRYNPAEGSLEWALGGIQKRRAAFLDLADLGAKRRMGARRTRMEGGAPPRTATNPPAVLLSLLLGAGASWAETAEELLQPLVQAFGSAPRSSFLRFKDFALYQTAMANPLIPLRETGGDSAFWSGLPPMPKDDFLEDLWQSFLHAFLSFGLIALGGAVAGSAAGAEPCFMVNGRGRRLLEPGGPPGDGEDEDGERLADILVQPTFEVAFLSPAPAAEAEIARFAERTGREVGALFRITKGSILRAARSGLSAERVIGSLGRMSKKPIPSNVEHEIRGWISQA
jgi:hypothetical protein